MEMWNIQVNRSHMCIDILTGGSADVEVALNYPAQLQPLQALLTNEYICQHLVKHVAKQPPALLYSSCYYDFHAIRPLPWKLLILDGPRGWCAFPICFSMESVTHFHLMHQL